MIAESELRALVRAEIHQHVANTFGYTILASTTSMGGDAVQLSDSETGQRPAQRLEPFGFRSVPPTNVRALWARMGSSNVAQLGTLPSSAYGLSDLATGDACLYNTTPGVKVKLTASDGSVTITDQSNSHLTWDGAGNITGTSTAAISLTGTTSIGLIAGTNIGVTAAGAITLLSGAAMNLTSGATLGLTASTQISLLSSTLQIGVTQSSPGSGSTATLATVGTGGPGKPATAAQFGWLPFSDASGNPCFLPVWK